MNDRRKEKKGKRSDFDESQGSRKIINYFMDLILRNDFQDEVTWFRKKYNIPPRGFDTKEEHILIDGVFPVPKRWIHSDKDKTFWKSFSDDEQLIADKFNLPPGNRGLIDAYVMYRFAVGAGNLCQIQDCNEIGKYPQFDKEQNQHFPVALRISPYASQRDVTDYIRIFFEKEIKPLQDKYKDTNSSLGKAREKSYTLRARDAFIYDHRHLPRKQILEMVKEKYRESYDTVDEGSIGKIISLIDKKRKQA